MKIGIKKFTCASFAQRTLGLAFALSAATLAHAQTVPFETVYKFQRDSYGFNPSNLILGNDQTFYGTTAFTSTPGGYGTLFQYTPADGLTTLHTFTGLDGADPVGGLLQASDGSLYGTAFKGGAFGVGTFYHFDNNFLLTPLYSFTCQTDGCNPIFLLEKPDGHFYVTTTSDVNTDAGAIVQFDALGQITVVHDFDNADGFVPNRILLATDGNYYGNTAYGGSGSAGTI